MMSKCAPVIGMVERGLRYCWQSLMLMMAFSPTVPSIPVSPFLTPLFPCFTLLCVPFLPLGFSSFPPFPFSPSLCPHFFPLVSPPSLLSSSLPSPLCVSFHPCSPLHRRVPHVPGPLSLEGSQPRSILKEVITRRHKKLKCKGKNAIVFNPLFSGLLGRVAFTAKRK